ncbi:MAG: cyanophycin synthetase [Azovibrio sp.]|nr:cyanophycin synthetase [Azovibrio sp.]
MTHKSIEFRRIQYLRGPNIWTYRPVLEALVDIGELEDFPSNKIPGFYERLSAWLPSLIEHRCSYEERGGFLRRVQEGTWPGHILEHVTLELQNLAGMPGGFGKAREVSERGVYKVVVRAWNEQVTRAALQHGRDLVMAAIEDKPFDVAACIEHLKDLVDTHCLGPSTACIVDAADDRDIPAIRLTTGNLVQLGYGCRQRRIWTAETDRTSAIAESISRDKDLTKTLLKSCGLPVPEGYLVDSPEAAWEAAEDIGLPVVVKPDDGNHGRGVFLDLNSRAEVEAAYRVASEEGSNVIVERYIPGIEHRLLVVGSKVVAATRGEIAQVVGDGRHSIRELIDLQINADPRRGSSEEHPLNFIGLDSAARLEIQRQGYTPEDVPAEGKEVVIQRIGNLAIDCTDEVHPDTARAVVLAARVVGLDIAGVDLVAKDISQPLAAQGGAIVEVNAGPGLLMHLKPAQGQPRPVGEAIVELLFPQGESGRIPVVGITGARGKTRTARLLTHFLDLSGQYIGLACSDGIFLNRRQVETGSQTAKVEWEAARRVLMNRQVQAAVIENGAEAILRDGLAYDRCQVGIVLNSAPMPDLSHHYIETPEQIYTVLRTQVDVVLAGGAAVLNAADPLVADMARLSDGEVIFFAADGEQPVLREHCLQGGRAVFVRAGQLVLAQEGREVPGFDLASLAPSFDASDMESLLAAVAAAWALGLGMEVVRAGLETFSAIA